MQLFLFFSHVLKNILSQYDVFFVNFEGDFLAPPRPFIAPKKSDFNKV